MKIISKQDLPDIKKGTLLATNDGMDEPWKLFILGDLFVQDGVVTDFWMVDPLNGEQSREQMYDDYTTYIMFDADDIDAIIGMLHVAKAVQFP
jgi:hypothetical protein